MTRRRKRSRKWISWLVLIILAVLAGVVCYFVYDNYFRTEEKPAEETSVTETKAEDEGAGEETIEEASAAPEKEKVKQYEGEDPNTTEEITGVITYAGVSGEKLMIRVNIDQYLSGGSCALSLLKNGATVYTDTAGISGVVETATCEGFDVPTSALGTGEIEIIITVSAEGKGGTIKGEAKI